MSNTNSTATERAEQAQQANFRGKSPDGYNHPTGTLPQAGTAPALEENALKSIVAEKLKAANTKRAARKQEATTDGEK